ncbi:MAG TPA: hypothetical protein PKY82_30245, partial [Pyrinomonadaceae bacterium]|nr:hypothetical protein [Pyrinomonadaceae bacterium]
EVVRRAAAQTERLYAAMVKQRNSLAGDEQFQSEDLLFDPTRPIQTDWEQLLAKVAEKLIAGRKKKN